jgi:exosortase
VALALLASRRAELRAAVGAPARPLGPSLLLAPGLALLAWGRFVSAPDLALLGTLAMAIGGCGLAFGARLARLVAVPLGLLVFCVPVPGALVNQVVYPLQLWTASYAQALLQLLGVATFHTADVIRTSTHNFLVIEGCSGLGSMEVLALLALAWAWQTRASFGHGLALVLAAPLIAFALNGFRVAALVVFPDSDVWSVHTTQGVVAFALGTLLIALLDRLLTRRKPEAPAAAALPPAAWPAAPRRVLLAWLGAAAVASLLPRYEQPSLRIGGTLLPETLGEWTSSEVEIDRLYLGSVRFSRAAHRRYSRDPATPLVAVEGPEPVTAFVGEDATRSGSTSLLSEKLALPGRGWTLDAREALEIPGGGTAHRVLARIESRRVLAYTLSYGLGSVAEETLRAFLALDRSPWRRPRAAYLLRVSTQVAPEANGERRAERRILGLLRILREGLEPLTGMPGREER